MKLIAQLGWEDFIFLALCKKGIVLAGEEEEEGVEEEEEEEEED